MIRPFSFFPSLRATAAAGFAVAALAGSLAGAQVAPPTVPTPAPQTQTSADGSTTTTTSTAVDGTGKPTTSVTSTRTFGRGRKKDDKVVATKDTKKELRKEKKVDVLVGQDAKLPDKQLYDKAVIALKKGRYDVARLDLQTMLNTYPDSQYQMRAKLAIADSWYKEGGTAALTQAESEYADFRVFFPNVPEAAEAQMRIGDIYFREMDKPDRDFQKAMHAEEEYRRMLTDYPDSTLVPQAKQRLREVQEVLANRESDIASYYATRENWAAVIARYQTVADTYPLYSHMDDTLIGLGDAYEAQARYVRGLKVTGPGTETAKAALERLYDSQAAECYRKVVLEHSAAPHVEDARDRLAAMNLPIPVPTREQAAASEALENSRATYKITDKLTLLVMHKPDAVTAARIGEPPMVDAKPTTAPAVVKRVNGDFTSAFKSGPAAPAAVAATETAAATTNPAPAAVVPSTPAAPLAFGDVGTESSAPSADRSTFTTPGNSVPATAGNHMSVEILGSTPSTLPAAEGKPDPNYGLKAVGPRDATPLPPVERAAGAPDRPNEITAPTPAAQTAPANGKKAKVPEFDKGDESSSKHKKKKGLKKIVEPL